MGRKWGRMGQIEVVFDKDFTIESPYFKDLIYIDILIIVPPSA